MKITIEALSFCPDDCPYCKIAQKPQSSEYYCEHIVLCKHAVSSAFVKEVKQRERSEQQ